MIDCIAKGGWPRSFAMEGIAVLRIVPSNACMKKASAAIQGI
jgi:hypothetical protein